jgi:signal transduction histidine kinase
MPRRGWRPRWSRLPRRTLRVRLALLYAALFCVSAVALAAVALVFRPDFLMGSSIAEAPGTPAHRSHCCQWGQSAASITATVVPDLSQNPAGVAMVGVMVVLAIGVGWLVAGRLVRPLRAITASARDISASNLHRRLGLRGHDDEFTELGQTLDDLFARLEASFDSQRHFIANASHELRTPLTAGRALLQVAIADPEPSIKRLRATCEELVELGDQQELLIAALLTLANSQRGLGHPEPLDLADITGNVLQARQAEAGRRGIRLRSALAAGAVLAVSNTGALIAPGEVEDLFQPFRQLGAERIRHGEGHGLGLAIVRAIADAHGAALTARPSREAGSLSKSSFPDARGRRATSTRSTRARQLASMAQG